MSKHGAGGKRLSVFERLGPGTESETQHVPTPPPPPPPSRHRHYPVERHSERGVHSLSAEDRHKSLSDQDVLGLKHHDGDASSRNRSSHLAKTPKERSKVDHVYLSHSSERMRGRHPGRGESTSSSTSGSMSDGEKDDGRRKRARESISSRRGKESGDRRGEHSGRADEQLMVVDSVKEEDRRRRKRERQSIGDGDSGRMVKRAHLDTDGDHSHRRSSEPERRHTRERRDAVDRKKQRQVDSQSDTETATDSLLDWSAIARLPLPAPSRKTVSHLDKFAGGALLASVGCSAQLAGEALATKAQQAVSSYIQVTQEGLLPESVLKQPFGDEELTSSAASYLQNQISQAGLLYELRPCRRALTAQADCSMRKQLKNTGGSKINCYDHPSLVSWDRELYASSVALYQSLGQKQTSSKPPLRLSTSRVGALLSPR